MSSRSRINRGERARGRRSARLARDAARRPPRGCAKMSNVERSKCSGGWPEMRSDGRVPKYRVAHSTNAITFACVITTPFGAPVEPEVNRRWARSSRAASVREEGRPTEAVASDAAELRGEASAGQRAVDRADRREQPGQRTGVDQPVDERNRRLVDENEAGLCGVEDARHARARGSRCRPARTRHRP